MVGGSVIFKVVLDAPAEPGGEFVALFCSPSDLLMLPASLYVPDGETEAQFKAVVGPTSGIVTVSAQLGPSFLSDEIEILDPLAVVEPPHVLSLGLVVPNPISRASRIGFTMPSAGQARLAVFDIRGRAVAVLADGAYSAGRHAVAWSALPPGIYLLRLAALGEDRVAKAVVVR
jgi:hypothetical protein